MASQVVASPLSRRACKAFSKASQRLEGVFHLPERFPHELTEPSCWLVSTIPSTHLKSIPGSFDMFFLHLVNQSIILCLLTVNQSSEICTLMSRKRIFCSSAIGFPVSANEHGSIPGAAKTSNGAQMVYLEHIRCNVLVLCYCKTYRTRGATFQPPPRSLERKGNENEPTKSIPCCSVLETLPLTLRSLI